MHDWEITLVTEAQTGNTKCFEELYELYHNKVFAVIRTTVKNRADAEDILQQTFLSAWRNLKNLSNPAAFNTWIQRIAINHCYELLRKKNIAILMDSEHELDSLADEISDELIPAVYAEREDLRIRMGRILEDLSEVQRQSITLFYFNELKVEEIAEIMKCSANTVKTRLFLARKAIRSEIEEQERKSGQKFYGIAGIPMLPLAQILSQQIEAASLSPAVSSGILESITSTIAGEAAMAAQVEAEAGSAASSAAATSTASTGATAAGTAAKTGIPLVTKVIAGVVAAGIIIAAIVVFPRLLDPPTDDHTPPAATDPQTTESAASTSGVSDKPKGEIEPEESELPTQEAPDYTEVYAAYLEAYRQYQWDIAAYDWSWGDGQVTVCDIIGDATPELLYVTAFNRTEAYLHVYQYEDGQVARIYYEIIDIQAGSGTYYCLFTTIDGRTILYERSAGFPKTYSFKELVLANGAIVIDTVFQYDSAPSEDHTTFTNTYFQDDADISESEYLTLERDAVGKMKDVVIWSCLEDDGPVWEKIFAIGTSAAMPAEEAIHYLIDMAGVEGVQTVN